MVASDTARAFGTVIRKLRFWASESAHSACLYAGSQEGHVDALYHWHRALEYIDLADRLERIIQKLEEKSR